MDEDGCSSLPRLIMIVLIRHTESLSRQFSSDIDNATFYTHWYQSLEKKNDIGTWALKLCLPAPFY